ncbi:cholesteryl ester transfer protein [Echinops telfairi]|uniref:Cholesteryl ester transfer protein n=1 Tax=Echinops telfairi TaxID=9371 RepID=A0AC55DDK9_ECHTE|nr:cholesteryl ester transfer protein [Echinops telfairi]
MHKSPSLAAAVTPLLPPENMLAATLLALALLGSAQACPNGNSYAAGIVCRITKPATLVLNQETTKVIQTVFQRASYPDIEGEKSMLLLGQVKYSLHNIQIGQLSIASSQVELVEDESVDISVQNVSGIFKGTLNYSYTSAWGLGMAQSVNFEIHSSVDLQINTQLTCDSGLVQATTLDCYLSFHKLLLNLHGDHKPGWFQQLFTNFISFTLKMILKGQVCREVDIISNIMADFVQKRAAHFLSNGDIKVDISLTRSPVIKSTYLESHHKGYVIYRNVSQVLPLPTFAPSLLGDSRMLYFWFSDQVLDSLAQAAFLDGRFTLSLTGDEFKAMLETQDFNTNRDIFQEDITTTVQASYSKKKLFLKLLDFHSPHLLRSSEAIQSSLRSVVAMVGIPDVMSRLEVELTAIVNSKGLDLFEIINPEIITRDGYLLLQMDFGFPEHLLVDFLQRLT